MNVKKLPKTLHFVKKIAKNFHFFKKIANGNFFEKMKIFGNLKKKVKFLAIFRYSNGNFLEGLFLSKTEIDINSRRPKKSTKLKMKNHFRI